MYRSCIFFKGLKKKTQQQTNKLVKYTVNCVVLLVYSLD